MYILPQIYIIEAKKLLKIKLEKIIVNITDEFIENLFNINPNNKYQNLMLKLDIKVKKVIIDIIIDVIKILDNLYFESEERKKYFNKCNKYSRSIITIFGEINFERIYYYDKSDKTKHFYFIDNLFGFPEYDRYDEIVKGIAIDNALKTNQNKGALLTNNMLNSISETINNNEKYNISRQTIYNWINDWNEPKIEYESIETDSDTLYIMIDEKYIHEQIKSVIDIENKKSKTKIESKTDGNIENEILEFLDKLNNLDKQPLMLPAPKEKKKNYIMSKAFITFTGVEQKHKRKTLKNKTTFLTANKNAWEDFTDFISKIYDFAKFKNIKVLSDAGTWIVNGISNLKLYSFNEIVHCLCEFHVKQKINRITHDDNQRRLLKSYVINNQKEDFITLINSIIETKKEQRKNTIETYKSYIIKYWNAFKNMLESCIRSSMESHISHNIAKYFSYEPKAFSKRRIQKLLKLQEYRANEINILGLYLKTHKCKEKITIKKEELNFNIFNSSTTNMPILYSESSITRKILSNLVN